MYFAAAKSPVIVHFTTKVKPWNTPSCALGKRFWSYARMSPFYEEIVYENQIYEEFVYRDPAGNQNPVLMGTNTLMTAFSFRIGRAIIFISKKLRNRFRNWLEDD